MAEEDTKQKKTKAPKAEKKERAKTVGRHPVTARIRFGEDKDGKPYSATQNNPKREKSAANAAFALYRSNMTIQQALDAGVPAANIAWDLDKGFIKIVEAA